MAHRGIAATNQGADKRRWTPIRPSGGEVRTLLARQEPGRQGRKQYPEPVRRGKLLIQEQASAGLPLTAEGTYATFTLRALGGYDVVVPE